MNTTAKTDPMVTVTLTNTDESRNSRPKKMTQAKAESLASIHKGMVTTGPKGRFVVDHAVMAAADGEPFAFRP